MAINVRAWIEAIGLLDRLTRLEDKHQRLIDAQATEIQALKDRVLRLEVRLDEREKLVELLRSTRYLVEAPSRRRLPPPPDEAEDEDGP